MLDPVALVQLKQTGQCFVNLPEAIFDLDYPGHYMRRIKSVSLTIPCVIGPYTSVNCTLTFVKNSVRKNTAPGTQYARNTNNGVPTNDDRFVDNIGVIQSIVTSSAQNDSGLFELNFRDERYLPFEGAGAISDWQLELSGKWKLKDPKDPKDPTGKTIVDVDFMSFDFDTISDVVFHMRYTARDGGDALRQSAVGALQAALNELILAGDRQGLYRLFSIRHEFPNEWHRFLQPQPNDTFQTLEFQLSQDRFPYLFKEKTIKPESVVLLLSLRDSTYEDIRPLKLHHDNTELKFMKIGSPVENVPNLELDTLPSDLSQPYTISLRVEETDLPATVGGANEKPWWMEAQPGGLKRLNPEKIMDIWLVCRYTVEVHNEV